MAFDRKEARKLLQKRRRSVHDKVRLDQLYGKNKGMTMSLWFVGIDSEILRVQSQGKVV